MRLVPQSLFLLFAVSLLTRIFFIFKYGEEDLEADSYLHYLASQGWIHSPLNNFGLLISVWTKPLFTFVSGIVLKITVENIITIKLLNMAVWIGILYLIYLIGKEYKLSKETLFFSIFFSSFSFLAFRSSITSLTEPLFTLVVVAAYYLLLRKKFIVSSLLVSVSFLCRTEGIIFIIIWGIYFLINKKYRLLVVLPTFPLLWNLVGFLRYGDMLYVINTGYPLISTYGKGDLPYYIIGLLKYEPIIFSLFIISLFLCINRFVFMKLCVLSFLLFHIVIWDLGILGSAGILRYFVPIIPFMSILASRSLLRIVGYLKIYKSKSLVSLLYLIIVISQLTYTFSLINGNGVDYVESNSPHVDREIMDSGIFIHSLDKNKTLYAEDPALIYFSKRILDVDAYGGQPPENISNIYFAFNKRYNTGDKKLSYYLNKYKLIKNFNNYTYIFESP